MPTMKSAHDKDRRVGRRPLHDSSESEQRASEQQRALAADPIAERAAGERARQGAQRDPTRHHLDHQEAERKGRLDPRQRAGNHALVVAEQPPREDDDGENHGQPSRHPVAYGRRLDHFRTGRNRIDQNTSLGLARLRLRPVAFDRPTKSIRCVLWLVHRAPSKVILFLVMAFSRSAEPAWFSLTRNPGSRPLALSWEWFSQSSVTFVPPACLQMAKRSPRLGRTQEPVQFQNLEWLPFISAYRTMCPASDAGFRRVLEGTRNLVWPPYRGFGICSS